MGFFLPLVASLLGLSLFGLAVDLPRLFPALQPLIVGLSIMAAAVFVRLNRGMPSLDWKSLEPRQRSALTGAIVRLTAEYAAILGLMSISLVVLVVLTAIGVDSVRCTWPELLQKFTSAGIGALLSLCAARMVYVVWRDYDIVKLQKTLIDAAGNNENAAAQNGLADQRVVAMRKAAIRRFQQAPPKAWDEE
jgi:hypothetical protein